MRNKLDVKKRVKNFDEIVIPFTREQAVAEARRCLRCPNPPCEIACPIKTELRDAFAVLADLGDNACDKAWQKAIVEAYDILKTNNCLPSVTARVCPHSKFCEGACTRAKKERAVDIARLKAYICDTYYKLQAEKMQGQIDKLKAQVKGQEKLQGGAEKDNRAKKQNCVAIIGYGPSAIACAEYLANSGVGVSVYAKYLGGLLNTGIPAFRLPHAVWGNELSFVGASVDLKLEQVSNFNDIKAFTQKLLAKYKAVFVAVGLQKSTSLGIDGEALGNIFYFDSFLKNAKLGIDLGVSIQPKNIAVIGGGNAALDSARVARRIFPSADVQ
ncbi:MAG: FAD-dependent oxidoreductase, partial [Firmicutes bacterium]|nr:FAD-dependent oxidoreductase [Bacillota bacterium]